MWLATLSHYAERVGELPSGGRVVADLDDALDRIAATTGTGSAAAARRSG